LRYGVRKLLCREHYEQSGIGADYVDTLIR